MFVPLQWGRRLSTTETVRSLGFPQGIVWLQWGRRLSTTETEGQKQQLMLTYQKLQWGRRLSTTETQYRRTEGSSNKRLQWGRRLSTTETTYWERGHARKSDRFNGAVVFQRRKPQRSVLHNIAEPAASMGPSSFNDGNIRHTAGRRLVRPASMGPSSFNDGNMDEL